MLARGLIRAQLTRPRKGITFNYAIIQRRHISILEPLASGIIETGHIFSSLPLFSSLPPYSSAIIAITLALRTGITLPMALWSRARAYRREHIVGPALKAWREETKEIVGKAFARDKKPYEEYQAEMGRLQAAKIKELNKIHRCSPLPTMIAPFAIHAPLFILATASFRQATLTHTAPMNPLAAEPFLTLPSLAHTDPTGVLPIAVGLLMFSNVELGRLSRPAKRVDSAPSSKSGGPPSTELPQMSSLVTALENGLRGASILFIWVAMQSPGAVVIYWLTSASYTLVERLAFMNFGKRETGAIKQPDVEITSSPPSQLKGRNARRVKTQL